MTGAYSFICKESSTVNDEFQYDADVRLRESKTPLEVIDAEFRKVLAQIGAHDVQEIERFD